MALQPFDQTHVEDTVLKRLITSIANWTRQLTGMVILQGQYVEGVEVTTSTTTISHQLGRTPRGWIICKKNADARVWESSSTSSQLILDSSATVTISIWIF